MNDSVNAGDHVTVDIASPANPFGSTQMAHFIVDEVNDDSIVGTDPDWGDACEVTEMDTDSAHYSDGMKSGDVVEVKVHESHKDGGYYGDKYTVVWSDG